MTIYNRAVGRWVSQKPPQNKNFRLSSSRISAWFSCILLLLLHFRFLAAFSILLTGDLQILYTAKPTCACAEGEESCNSSFPSPLLHIYRLLTMNRTTSNFGFLGVFVENANGWWLMPPSGMLVIGAHFLLSASAIFVYINIDLYYPPLRPFHFWSNISGLSRG